MRVLLLLSAILFSISSFGQKKKFNRPDYNAIEAATSDKNSAYYYPPLFERFNNNDTTLEMDEYKYLYYGYFYHKPEMATIDEDKELSKAIDSLLSQEKPGGADLRKARELAVRYVEHHPFDMRKLNLLYQLNMELSDTLAGIKYFNKVKKMVYTILNSGDGKTCESGYHVTEIPHEYFILNVKGYQSAGQGLADNCDYLRLKSNEDNVTGIYFDVSQIFAGYEKLFKDVKLTLPEPDKKKKRRKG